MQTKMLMKKTDSYTESFPNALNEMVKQDNELIMWLWHSYQLVTDSVQAEHYV